MEMKKNICSSSFLAFLLIAHISCSVENKLESIFTERDVEGSIIISSLDGEQQFTFNPERIKRAYLPASTFKIPNTLIALDEGAISNPDEIFKWDGKVRFVESWNQDHSLTTAFPASVVWFYQELARCVGNDAYIHHLERIGYGNRMTGSDVSTFWLEGELKITSIEQIAFLKMLYNNQLPYQLEHVNLVKELMIVDETEAYTLRAKTGWTTRTEGQHGWYVGYLEVKDKIWFFATNIEMTAKIAHYRKEITMEAFKQLGLI